MRPAAVIGAIGVTLFLSCGRGDQEEVEVEQPHQTMGEIFENIVVLLPASVDPEGFASPGSRASIQARLDLLADASDSLQRHTRAKEATFAQLSRTLTRDVEASRDRYALGDYEDARERLVGSIWNCVECHSLQRSARRFSMAERLLESVELEPLPPHERALLHVLARRMPEAITIWEAMFVDPDVSPAQVDAAGAFRDYLAIALRVENQPERAARVLRATAQRADLPHHLESLLPRWIEILDEFENDEAPTASLEHARALKERADRVSTGPEDRSRLVLDIINSGVLLEFVQDDKHNAADRAEAYFLLGQIEARGLGPFSAPKSELHLETAIRTQPDGPFADRAFELLAARTAGPYGGLQGLHLPDSVREQLQELRALIDSSRERAKI